MLLWFLLSLFLNTDVFIFIQFTVGYCTKCVTAVLAESSLETGSALAVGLTWLNQNKKYKGCAACQYSLKLVDIGFYADTLLQTFKHGGLWRLLAEDNQYQVLQLRHW